MQEREEGWQAKRIFQTQKEFLLIKSICIMGFFKGKVKTVYSIVTDVFYKKENEPLLSLKCQLPYT